MAEAYIVKRIENLIQNRLNISQLINRLQILCKMTCKSKIFVQNFLNFGSVSLK